jgi:hypothetical protein
MALTSAIQALVDFAAAHVEECKSRDEQVRIYLALAETLPNPIARQTARQLAEAQSKVAALQLDFQELLSTSRKA